jgi:uncharacterized protein YbjT (DUF2867 family)
MSSPVLVTGGTGTLGRRLVPLLQRSGHEIRVLSRRDHDSDDVDYVVGDLATGDGVDRAVAGVRTVVHCAGSAKGDGGKARALMAAASGAGVEHVVHISVVGADRVPVASALDRAMFGYLAAKREAEQVVTTSRVPWTILRATQFHELVLTTVAGMSKLPIVPVPSRTRFQPVAATEVAERLAELADGPPAGLVADVAGPSVESLSDLIRAHLRATGRRRLLLPVHLPGRAARALRDGANLSLDPPVGRQSWQEFLDERLGARSVAGDGDGIRPGPSAPG